MKKNISFAGGAVPESKAGLSLAKNDFKTKYAGSYLGIVWAFIQPIVTILVYWFVFYWFVFSVRLTQMNWESLLLLSGSWYCLVFFSDALSGGTS